MKKLTSLLVALAMVLSLMAPFAMAEELSEEAAAVQLPEETFTEGDAAEETIPEVTIAAESMPEENLTDETLPEEAGAVEEPVEQEAEMEPAAEPTVQPAAEDTVLLVPADSGEQSKALINNQCFEFAFTGSHPNGAANLEYYHVTNSVGAVQSLSSVYYVNYSASLGYVYRVTFASPLPAGSYTLYFNNGTTNGAISFEVSLYLRVIRVLDSRNLVIQLNSPVYGCTVGNNYFLHSLSGTTINVTRAVSCFTQMGGTTPNVFQLTTDRDIALGTTYVVETRTMSLDAAGNQPCQGTIAYVTPTAYAPWASPINITNNQSIIVTLSGTAGGSTTAANYIVRNSAGAQMPVGNVRSLGNNKVEVNFTSPLTAGTYTISTQNMTPALSGSFTISLYLRIVRIESNSVIIQLNSPVYGCTDAPNYFIHKLGSSERISATQAVSVFSELGGRYPNVFRITLPTTLSPNQTYIIETKNMALDSSWRQPCQGTIAYINVPDASAVLTGSNSVPVSAGQETIRKFTASSAGFYTFYSVGSSTTVGRLYGADMTLLKEKSYGRENGNFCIPYYLTAGQTVYLGVRYEAADASGSCDVVVQAPAAQKVLTADANILSVPAGQTIIGRFTAPSAGEYTFYTTGNLDTYGYLFGADGKELTWNDDGGAVGDRNFRIVRALTAGQVVYVGVRCFTSSDSGSTTLYAAGGDSPITYRALLIGQVSYAGDSYRARGRNDVNTMASLLSGVNGGQYAVTSKVDLTKSQVQSAISTTFADADDNDVSLFFYSGHGVTSSGTANGALTDYKSALILTSELASWLDAIPGKVILIISSCGSGGMINKDGEAVDEEFDEDLFNQAVISAFAANDRLTGEKAADVSPEEAACEPNAWLEEKFVDTDVPEQPTFAAKSGEMLTGKYYVLVSSSRYESSWGQTAETGRSHFVIWLENGISGAAMPADSNSDRKLTLHELAVYVQGYAARTPFSNGTVYQHPQVYPANSGYVLFTK